MAFWDRLFRRNKQKNEVRSIVTNLYGGNYQYFVWNYANNIYNIPEVRTAIEKIADIFASMKVYSIRTDKDDNIKYMADPTERILNFQPNPLQNATQFYKTVITKLLLDNNAFIEPVFNTNKAGDLKMLYPIPYNRFTFETSEDGSIGYVQFLDAQRNPTKRYNLNNIIYLNRFSTLSGGKESDLSFYETVLKSLGEQIVNVASPNKPRAILQSNQVGQGQLKEKDKSAVTNEVRARFADNVQGVAYLDKMWTITPINWNENDVNKDLMKFIVEQFYKYYNINEKIIDGTATEIEMANFINTMIKPLAIQFSQEFTNKLFSENEYYFGRRIEFDYHSLLITTLQSRTAYYQAALRNGWHNIDEVRELEGYGSLPNGKGKVFRTSADLVNVDIVDDYELGKVNKTPDMVSAADVSQQTSFKDEGN